MLQGWLYGPESALTEHTLQHIKALPKFVAAGGLGLLSLAHGTNRQALCDTRRALVQSSTPPPMTLLQVFLFVALPITGMAYAILGSIKLPLTERLKMDEARVGGLISAFGFMVGPVIFLAGFLADTLGRQGVILGGSVLVGVSLLILGRTTQYRWAVLAVTLLSAGWAAMINVANALIFLAYQNIFMATNLLNFMFGVGAFLTPLVLGWMIRRFELPRSLMIFAVLSMVPALMAPAVNMQSAAGAVGSFGFGRLVQDPVMWLCALTLMFWVPLESCTAIWTTTFVSKLSPPAEPEARGQRLASWTLSGFWLCFMGSRLLAALLLQGDAAGQGGNQAAQIAHGMLVARQTLIALAFLCLVWVLLIVFSRSRRLTIAVILLAGLTFGPFFPSLMAILLSHFPSEVHGRAVGVLFGTASIGWTIIPMLVGNLAKRTTVQRSFLIIAGSTALLLGLTIVHYFYARQ